ncbi:hypothetical protein MNBD_DELTA02-1134 [hydrothermal vent metagenome]|uniref:DUF2769 domain-containing protein n=1 Tax=hydrothermal vent metagenome TaxID=652676 RepID=A0A3B0VW90_9ZZZZ
MVKSRGFDRFGVEKMSDEEYEACLQGLEKDCLCNGCSSYLPGDENTAFCFPVYGASSVIKVENECLCTTCSVYKQYELENNHYCTRCSNLCQTYKEMGTSGP